MDREKELEQLLLEQLAHEGWGDTIFDAIPEADREYLQTELFPSFLDAEVERIERLKKRHRWLWAGIGVLALAAIPLLLTGGRGAFATAFFLVLAALVNGLLMYRLRRKQKLINAALRAIGDDEAFT